MNLYLDTFTIIITLVIVGSTQKLENRIASSTRTIDFRYLK